MKRKEIAYLMAIIKTAYPEYYRQSNDIEDTINLWQEMMQDDDEKFISLAVKEFIKTDTKGFPPKIGQIRGIAKTIRSDERMRERSLELDRKTKSAERIAAEAADSEIMAAYRKEVMERMKRMIKEV